MTRPYDDIISDMYKDATGHRPGDLSFFDAMTDAEQDAYVERLQRDIDDSIRDEQEAHRRAEAELESTLTDLIAAGAGDRETALVWLVQSLGDSVDFWYGGDHVAYHLGLPYTHGHIFEPAVRRLSGEAA